MSNDEQLGTTRSAAGTVMTPQASAIAGFTLAALALTGQGAWTGLAQAFFGSNFAPSSLGSVLASGFLATLVVEGIALLLARHALAEPGGEQPWVGHLARAAVLLAVIGGVFSVLALVASLVLQL
ncbi:MAG: hypothetical protein ABIQ59_01280 [Nocardioidaceae bacterium]